MAKKLMVYLDEDRHEDLKELAHRSRTTMAELVRSAIEDAFEDDLDAVRAQRLLEEAATDPEGAVSWQKLKAELRAKREGALPGRV